MEPRPAAERPDPAALLAARRKSGRRWLIGIGIAAVVLLGSSLISRRGDGASGAGSSAAATCVKSVDAMREYSQGTRSLASTLTALHSAEPNARRAARLDAKYEPIAQAIVAAQAELAAGTPGTASKFLIDQCS